MKQPTMLEPWSVAPETTTLTAYLPIPGFGVLPVNAFVIHGAEPILVDAGVMALREPFSSALRRVIDPSDLRWLWLTHVDPDHIGGLSALLEEAPRLRIVTSFLGMGKLGLLGLQPPPERVYLINPGQSLPAGDRDLVAVRPPVFDAPETTGMFDTKTRALFTSDCFGGLLAEPAQRVEDIPPDALREGMIGWASVDAPWLAAVGDDAFAQRIRPLFDLGCSTLLSSHLPPAPGRLDPLVRALRDARQAPAFVGPDQAAMEQMLAS